MPKLPHEASYYSNPKLQRAPDHHRFVSLTDIIDQFMLIYVGEDKIISKAKRLDAAFHAQRGLAELSFDTLKSIKSQEITIPSTLQMRLPQDYVNYTKISWVDSAGIKHPLYATNRTSNPFSPQVDDNDDFLYTGDDFKYLTPSGELIRNGNFNGGHIHWGINQQWNAGDGLPPIALLPSTVSAVTATLNDPVTGWFFGGKYGHGNTIVGYDIPQYNGIKQGHVKVVQNEEYKVSVDVSSFTSGEFHVVLVSSQGNIVDFGSITADGTFTATATAGGTDSNQQNQSLFIRNKSATLGNIVIDNISLVRVGDEETSTTWSNYKSGTPSENQDDYEDDTYWPANGERYGLDPQHAQVNGSFFVDENSDKIYFSSNISGKTVVLDYISDRLGTDTRKMQVHKFAEEAMYKWILHALLSGKADIPEYQVNRLKKERFAAIRTAKLRLSNLNIEELTQVLRGKSKWIKH